MQLLISSLSSALTILSYLIIIEVIRSWLTLTGMNRPIPFITPLVEGILWAIRRVLPTQFLSIDVSPIVALFGIQLAQKALLQF